MAEAEGDSKGGPSVQAGEATDGGEEGAESTGTGTIGDGNHVSGAMFAMNCADSHGDYDLIYNGVHENLLNVPYNDPRCVKTCKVMDWLGFQDHLQRRVNEHQHWFLLGYMPPVAAAVHVLCCVDTRHRMDVPRQVSNVQPFD